MLGLVGWEKGMVYGERQDVTGPIIDISIPILPPLRRGKDSLSDRAPDKKVQVGIHFDVSSSIRNDGYAKWNTNVIVKLHHGVEKKGNETSII